MGTKTIKTGKLTYADFKKQFNISKLSGYIWMVEGEEPIIYNNEKIIFEDLTTAGNSFNKVQEAYLTDGTYAIHIKNIDGEELVFIHKFADFKKPSFKIKKVKFPSHIDGIDTIHFKQVCELMPSISGDDFKTWQPIVKLFVKIELKKD